MKTDNPQEQSAKNVHYPEPGYTHPDEMPIVEQRPNHHSDLRGMIVHFTSEMLDNPNKYGIYPTTNFYNDLEEAILDWHNKQVEEAMAKFHLRNGVKYDVKASNSVIVITHTNKLKERDEDGS